jgi:hypothetical protein
VKARSLRRMSLPRSFVEGVFDVIEAEPDRLRGLRGP